MFPRYDECIVHSGITCVERSKFIRVGHVRRVVPPYLLQPLVQCEVCKRLWRRDEIPEVQGLEVYSEPATTEVNEEWA